MLVAHLGDSCCNLSEFFQQHLPLKALQDALIDQSSNAFTTNEFQEESYAMSTPLPGMTERERKN